MSNVDSPFDSDEPVEYTLPPSEEGVRLLIQDIDQKLEVMGQIFGVHSILLYRIYDMLCVIADAVNPDSRRAVMLRHEQGELVSPAAWFNETQNNAGQGE